MTGIFMPVGQDFSLTLEMTKDKVLEARKCW